jgi:hypothetical protein
MAGPAALVSGLDAALSGRQQPSRIISGLAFRAEASGLKGGTRGPEGGPAFLRAGKQTEAGFPSPWPTSSLSTSLASRKLGCRLRV